MTIKKYDHLFLENFASTVGYKSKGSPGGTFQIPIRDRITHAQNLARKFDTIWREETELKDQRQAQSIISRTGSYIEFVSSADFELLTKSLEDLRQGIRLLNIRQFDNHTKATVYVPSGKENYFIKKISEYSEINTIKGNPKNAKLVNSIDDIKIALIEALWTDPILLMPNDSNSEWVEVWLRVDPEETLQQLDLTNFTELLHHNDIETKENYLLFPERAVLIINATRSQLIQLMMQSDNLAEIRICQEPAGFWVNESNRDQTQWVDNILDRLNIGSSNIKVCILDSGITQGHRLLQPMLSIDDCLTVNPSWGTEDHEIGSGHGTLMAGVIAYGELESELLNQGNFTISHKLCSVKILPRVGSNKKELYGDITKQAISRAEIQNPDVFILYCMAVTSSEDLDKGRPSSWSGAIDELAHGKGIKQRLILISAGNCNDPNDWINYPDSNMLISVQNPAQSWNALTVGAYTEKAIINDPLFPDPQVLAPPGGLSPFSTTSILWSKKWPIKPEVVFEGGNLLKDESGHLYAHEDLSVLSTAKDIQMRQFNSFNATSSATAQAAWFASQIALKYPNVWPETIRGLMVHSASWNEQMIRQAGNGLRNKGDIRNLMQIFGYGKPDLNKALYSNENAFSIIIEESVQPFEKKGSSFIMKDMHFYNLPWPKDILLALGELQVKLRITLSYFIEPGVGEIGWKDKYRYQSFGLRFDLNNETEDEVTFKKRINIAVREEDEDIESNSGSNRWKFGDKNRRSGSLHLDIWEGTAAQMALCNKVAVFPVIGWWRERHNLKKYNAKARYSLIVSLETPAIEQDIYLQVLNQIRIPIEIPTNT